MALNFRYDGSLSSVVVAPHISDVSAPQLRRMQRSIVNARQGNHYATFVSSYDMLIVARDNF